MMLPSWCMVPVMTWLGLQAADGGTDRADGLNSAREAASTVGLDVITLLDSSMVDLGASTMGRRNCCWLPSADLETRRNRIISSRLLLVRKWRSKRPAAMSDGTRSMSWNKLARTPATSLKASLMLPFSAARAQQLPTRIETRNQA